MSFSERKGSIFTLPATLVEKSRTQSFDEAQDYLTQKKASTPNVVVKNKKKRLIPTRYIITMLGFSSFLIMTAQRLNLSMGIVAMVNQTALQEMSMGTYKPSECPARFKMHSNDSTGKHHQEGNLVWDTVTQNNIVSASFLGLVLTQTPGGRMSETLGGRQVLVFSLVLASLCNLFSPIATDWGPYVLMATQFIKGLAQGLIIPAVSSLMAKWFPTPEKGLLSSITMCGFPGGAVVGGLLIGILCNSEFLGGWPLVFYAFGLMGLVLAFFVYQFGFNTPDEDSCITESEYKYIMSNLDSLDTEMKYKTPWKAIATSVSTWAGIIGMFGQYWITYFYLSVQPNYLGNALHFSHMESGYVNSLPYIAQIVVTWASSYFSDYVANKGYSSTDIMRKICNSLSCIGFSCAVIGITYSGCDKTLNITYLVTGMIFAGFGYPASQIAPLDMTINFAGTLMGIISTLASTSGFITPLVVGSLTSTEQSLSQWNMVMYISAGIVFSSGIIFALFGSAKIQEWDKITPNADLEGEENEAFDEKPGESCSTKPHESNGTDMSYVVIDRL
ncbi:sialin-like [Argiope bruennichi]|uniref:Sialin like protein n=1 Tax=Argiope bruennichi TaxID=94029 RepID=A0A8T0FBI0_ARGBR|nr:sialin-like [Argiope bruennichi]KAF8787702.1 Sialin like protein [Argiope bruennichi]